MTLGTPWITKFSMKNISLKAILFSDSIERRLISIQYYYTRICQRKSDRNLKLLIYRAEILVSKDV